MINRVVLVGRLTRDPELRRTTTGTAVTSFSIAIDNRPGRDGEKSTSFFNIVTWNQTAENVAKYVRKGSLVGVDGRLQQRSYEKNGAKINIVEIVADSVQFLEPKGSDNSPSTTTSGFKSDEPYDGEGIDTTSDDLPF